VLRGLAGHVPGDPGLLAAWLLLFALHLGAFASPGRVVTFLAIFAAVR
jgi:hypothetical protein